MTSCRVTLAPWLMPHLASPDLQSRRGVIPFSTDRRIFTKGHEASCIEQMVTSKQFLFFFILAALPSKYRVSSHFLFVPLFGQMQDFGLRTQSFVLDEERLQKSLG